MDKLERRADEPCPCCDCPPHEWCAQECPQVTEVPIPETARPDKLEERLRASAKAFREHPVYDSEGDGCYLGVQADELDEAADEITRLKGEVAGAQSTLAYLWKWVERGLFDPQILPADALAALAHHPSAPWKHGRWDVNHKPYAAMFYQHFPKAREGNVDVD